MQNRYTGDIGDYSKLGLLRALQSAGFSIGLNWYLTPDETHNSDGRHVNYLKQDEYRKCDEELWLGLKVIVDGEKRQVCNMENDAILKAAFFSVCLDFRGMKKAERTDYDDLEGAIQFARQIGVDDRLVATSCVQELRWHYPDPEDRGIDWDMDYS